MDPSLGPVLPVEMRAANMKEVWIEFFFGLVPPSALVFAALGSILFGFATPTEAAGCGALGSLLLALGYRKLTFKKLQGSLVKTLEISALIMVLVAASNFFGSVFARLGTPMLLTDFLLSLEMNRYLILAIVMTMIFLLGWPLEWVPIVMIIIPIILPLIEALGFNLTWFAILVAVNLQTAWLSPPVALSAYFLKGVVPEWDLKDIYLGMMQFMVLQVIGLIIIIIFPKIALWLPAYLYGQ
jgi:tripartite ATP-independent transporter DctM subunit